MVSMLILSTMMGLSSSSWITVWVCLEINTLAMCWVISKNSKESKHQESPIFLYYIIQVMASVVLLTMAISQESAISQTLLMFCLLMKMGVWPIHLWYMKLIDNMEMKQSSMLLVMTWQKILPIILILSILEKEEMKLLILALALLTLATPVTNLIKSLSVKSILASSSLNNNGWLMVASVCCMNTFFLFLFIYSITLWVTLKSMVAMTLKSMKTGMPFWSATLVVSNMGGLPPLTMFWAKVLIIKSAIESEMPSEVLLSLVLIACYFLYHYLWMMLNEMAWSPTKSQNTYKSNKEVKTTKMVTLTSMLSFVLLLTLGLTSKGFILMG
uniref:NADH-ubiquinone oxidoreductase chain 2 n=1 Tax=Rhizoglyphus robini TaxID=223528 RepID=A0A344AR66_9ACAR|nr:NADH dehydrogenase subunit 2 [Rhizoglyphus robini]AWX53542.1 NADH dehydrogenase subunit 2 [Rhizoglyphus robini]